MVKELKKLIAQKELISSQITKEINKIKIDALSSEDLIEFFNIVFPTFTSYDIYSPSAINELFHEMNFNHYDTFSMERHQTMDYDSLIDYVCEWDENYKYTAEDCKSLKKWANTSDLNEAKKKFQLEIIKIALSSQDRGFTYDW